MHGEFKDAGVDPCVHRDNAERMMAGFVPIFRAQGGDKRREGVPTLAEHGHEVVAQTLSVRDGSLCEAHPRLLPFLLRVCLEDAG